MIKCLSIVLGICDVATIKPKKKMCRQDSGVCRRQPLHGDFGLFWALFGHIVWQEIGVEMNANLTIPSKEEPHEMRGANGKTAGVALKMQLHPPYY